MKKLLPLIILIFAAASFGQTDLPKGTNWKYDKFKDKTFVDSILAGVKAAKNSRGPWGVTAQGIFMFKGDTLKSDIEIFFIRFEPFASCPSWCFIRNNDLIWILDGKRIEADKGEWKSLSLKSEVITYGFTRAEFEQIAKAQKVEFQIGDFESELKPKDLERFKTLLDLGTVKK